MNSPVPRYFVAIVAVVLLLPACTSRRFVYAPPAPNLAFFDEKGDAKVSAAYSGFREYGSKRTSHSYGLDVQAAYAITNHWALTASWYFRKENDLERGFFDSSSIQYHRSLFQAGAMYFVPMNQSGTITFNVYSGLGVGRFLLDESGKDEGAPYARFYHVTVGKWHLQPAIQFMPSKYFRAAVFFNPTFVYYGNYHGNYTHDEYDYFQFNNLNNKVRTVTEFGYSLQLGTPWIRGLYIDHSVSVISNPFFLELNRLVARQGNASIGLYFQPQRQRER